MLFQNLLLAAETATSGSISGGSSTSGMKDFVADLTNTLGIDLFDDAIDSVIFQTNQFLCNSEFIGSQGPFWWILQGAMALGALFSICVAGGISYKMMVKGEPLDVFKILKILGLSLMLTFWYPTGMTGLGGNNDSCLLSMLAYIPNCIGSYTHDLYEAEAVQVQEKLYSEDGKGLMDLIHKRDTLVSANTATPKAAAKKIYEEMKGSDSDRIFKESDGKFEEELKANKLLQEAVDRATFAGTMVGLDKFIMFISMCIYKIGWWSTMFCQQILLGMLTIFGPFQIAFSVLPKWEGAWAKWLIRYLTVHFYGAMLYFVGFYVLLLFDIVISIQIENLSAISAGEQQVLGYLQNTFLTAGYLLVASCVSLKCLDLVPDLASWMIPEGETSFSARSFGSGISGESKRAISSAIPKF